MPQSTFPSLKSENILVSHFIHSYALCTITRCLPLPPSVFHCIHCYALPSAAFHCLPLCSIAFIAMACTATRCLPLPTAVFHCIHCYGLHCHPLAAFHCYPLCSIAFISTAFIFTPFFSFYSG